MANDDVALRGFDMALPDIGDQLHFRQPLLSFGSNPTLYVARRVDWHADRRALAIVDDPEDLEMATLLTDGIGRQVASGQGVVVAGAEFYQAASLAGFQLDGFSRISVVDCESWIRVSTSVEFVALKNELIDQSRLVFDEELGKARRQRSRLTERGNAAMLILRRCGPLRREDLAIRQLAATRQNRDLDLYRRLLARFELELDEPEGRLHEKAERHIELAYAPATYGQWPKMPEPKAVPVCQDESLEARHDLEDTLRLGASIIKTVAEFMRDLDVLSTDTKRQCIGQDFEEHLKRAEEGVEEVKQMFNSICDP